LRREKQKACNEHGSSVNLDPRQVWCLDLRSVPPREGHRLPPSPLHIFKLSPWSGRSGGAFSEDVCEGRGCRCYAHRGVLWGRTPPSSGGCPVSPPSLAATGVTSRCTACAMPGGHRCHLSVHCVRDAVAPPPTRPESLGGQRRTFSSTVWPGRPTFGGQQHTCRSTAWRDASPVGDRNHLAQKLDPPTEIPIIGVSKPSHQPIRNETFRI